VSAATGHRPIVLRGGLVRTLDPGEATAQALVVAGTQIVAVLSDANDAPANAQVVDVEGGCIVPGFTDSHVHLPSWALARHGPNLRGAPNLDGALDIVAAWLKRDAGAGALRGRGWRDELWPPDSRPTRSALDALATDRPVVLKSQDSHSLWLNSAALALADGDLETPGGIVERGSGGEPTGILREEAAARYEARFPPTFEEALGALRLALPRLADAGVVAVHDKDGHRGALRLFSTLEREDELPLRVWQSLPGDRFEAMLGAAGPPARRAAALRPSVRVGYVKVFMDGTLGSRTARLLDGTGVEVTSKERLAEIIRRAAMHRLPVAAHAIGDRAVRDALDVFESTQTFWRGLRPRIEHAQCVDPSDVPRFAQLGVTASIQFSHATSDRDLADRIWGARASHSYPFRSLLDAGARLVAGSDAPCEEISPLAGMRAAVLRTGDDGRPPWRAEQSTEAADALAAFTREPAWLEHADGVRGRLAKGFAADLVVLDRDPIDHSGDARVRGTMLAGRWIKELDS
jgi:predicted amidohydrolase YtcJ